MNVLSAKRGRVRAFSIWRTWNSLQLYLYDANHKLTLVTISTYVVRERYLQNAAELWIQFAEMY